MPVSPGESFGRYKIISKLGIGGMGEVFLAEDTSLERKVAIKILGEDSEKDEERLARFSQEARAASALNHPNILTPIRVLFPHYLRHRRSRRSGLHRQRIC